ncbi:hypothetical protein KA005_15070, partial [bacterium]|nr:hypothetical protein [bacterium]
MFSRKNILFALGILITASLILSACAPDTIIETVVVKEVVTEIVEIEGTPQVIEKTVEVEVVVTQEVEVEVVATPVPEVVDRTGAWLDTVIFVEEPDSEAAVTRLDVGDLDVFAYNISEPDIAQRIFDSEVLDYETAFGNYNDLTFMPSTNPEFNNGQLNPFYSDKIREAMNWLVDRD